MLEDKSGEVRMAACWVLANLAPPDLASLPAMIRAVAEAPPEARRQFPGLVRPLGVLFVKAVLDASEKGHPINERLVALETLEALAPQEAGTAAGIHNLAADPDPRVQRAAQAAWLRLYPPRLSVEDLRAQLRLDHPVQRRQAAAALARRGAEAAASAVPELHALVRRFRVETPVEVMDALQTAGPAAAPALPDLLELIGTGQGKGALRVEAAVAAIGQPAVPGLEEAVRQEPTGRGVAAARALSGIEDLPPSILPALLEAVAEGKERIQRSAVKAIQQIDPVPWEELLEAMDSPSAWVRFTASDVLRRSELDIDILRPLLHDPRPEARAIAAYCLGAMGSRAESAIDALQELRRDPDNRVSKGAYEAIRRIRRDRERKR